MKDLPAPITPDRWLLQLFSARAVAEGGIVRRKVADVERLIGRRRLMHEVARRGYHLIEVSDQFVIICSQEPVKVLL